MSDVIEELVQLSGLLMARPGTADWASDGEAKKQSWRGGLNWPLPFDALQCADLRCREGQHAWHSQRCDACACKMLLGSWGALKSCVG